MEHDSTPKVAVRREEIRYCDYCDEDGMHDGPGRFRQDCKYCRGQKKHIAIVEYWVPLRYVVNQTGISQYIEDRSGEVIQRIYQYEQEFY